MIPDNVWNCLNLSVYLKAKPEYGTQKGLIEFKTGAPNFVCDVCITIKAGKKETTTIIDKNEMEKIRDCLSFMLQNSEYEK